MKDNNDWAIIGGGILGMTLALRLSEAGKKVTLYESSEKVGGLTMAWQMNDIVWDKYYHVVLMSDQNTRKILNEIGLSDQINWVETKTGFYSNGKLYSMSNIFEFFRFPPINLIDKFRLGLTIFVASKIKNWKRMESILVENWLTKWSGKRVFEKIWLPLLKAKLGDNYKQTSASFIWATIQRMYAARRSGLKKEMFGYVKGGYEKINNSFANHLTNSGIDIKYNSKIKKITTSEDATLNVHLNDDIINNHKHIISTLPSAISASITPELEEELKNRHLDIKYLGVICASVLLKKKLSPYYVTNITDKNILFTGVIEMTSLIPESELNGNNLIYLPKYVNSNDHLFEKNENELSELFVSELVRMYPELSREDVLFCGVSKARNVFSLPEIKYSEKLPGIMTNIPNLYFVNSAQIINGTLNVNETIQVAEIKLAEILNQLN